MIIPKNISFSLWAASLMVDYPNDNIPISISEDRWREWATYVADCNSFSGKGVIPPKDENNWMEWAQKVYLIMN